MYPPAEVSSDTSDGMGQQILFRKVSMFSLNMMCGEGAYDDPPHAKHRSPATTTLHVSSHAFSTKLHFSQTPVTKNGGASI